MADGFFPTLVSKDANANSQTNPLFHAITDGTDLALIDASGNLSVLVNNGAAGAAVNIQDGGNSITVDGTVTVTATNLDIRDLSHTQDSVKVGDGVDFVAVNVDGSLNVTDNGGSLTVDAVDLDIRNLTLAQDAVQVSANGSVNSVSNPIFVTFAQAPITGEVHNYSTATVAGGGTSNHDYTVVTAFLLKSVEFACSGGGKVELQVGPVATLVSKWVGFVPKQGGLAQVKFDPPIEVPVASTGTVRLIRTNREGSSQDLYSTIVGIDA